MSYLQIMVIPKVNNEFKISSIQEHCKEVGNLLSERDCNNNLEITCKNHVCMLFIFYLSKVG